MTDKIVVLCTCSSAEEGRRIARLLVEQRLAACVNVLPSVCSIYRWQGAIEESEEVLLLVKSRRDLFEPLRELVEKEHSYEVPELIALTVVEGADAYLSWMQHELKTEES